MLSFADMTAALQFDAGESGHYLVPNLNFYAAVSDGESPILDVVVGGQLLAQAIVAAGMEQPDKQVLTLNMVFARAGKASQPVELDIEIVHAGSSFASLGVLFRQNGKAIARGTALLHRPDADLVRHGPARPDVAGPDQAGGIRELGPGGQESVIPAAFASRELADSVNPPELAVWYRYSAAAAADGPFNQALVAFSTNFPIIGIALQPHHGFAIGQSHVKMSTGVVGHTITFHEPVDASQWLLFYLQSPYAGRGRAFGHGQVFTEDGRLVATFSQDSMIRGFEANTGPRGTSL